MNEHAIVEDLSPLLRCKVALAVNDTFLRKLPIFQVDKKDEDMAQSMFILELALSMKMVILTPPYQQNTHTHTPLSMTPPVDFRSPPILPPLPSFSSLAFWPLTPPKNTVLSSACGGDHNVG
jgi:hypothetical protein